MNVRGMLRGAGVAAMTALVACAAPTDDEAEPAADGSQALACLESPPGPSAVMIAQIRPFEVTPQLINDVCARSSFGPRCTVDQLTQITLMLEELSRSANNILPPTPFDGTEAQKFLATKEYRAYLETAVGASCNKSGLLESDPVPYVQSSDGFTPLRSPIGGATVYVPGSGNIYTKVTGGKGKSSATIEIQHNFRIEEGLGTVGQIMIPGSIVPWVWQNMKWQVSCGFDSKGKPLVNESVSMTASHFPSHYAYGGTKSRPLLKYAEQRDLPGFLFGPAIAKAGALSASTRGILQPCGSVGGGSSSSSSGGLVF